MLLNDMAQDEEGKAILEVGLVGDTWRFPVNRNRLAAKCEWFRVLFTRNMPPYLQNDPEPVIPIETVDKRAFDCYLKFIEGKSLDLNSVKTARRTLDAAHFFMCPGLITESIKYISENITPANVLSVYKGLGVYIQEGESVGTSPIADSCNEENTSTNAVCMLLRDECIAVIDAAPVDVLQQEKFEDLSIPEIARLAKRSQMKLNDERVLFKALEKWSAAECKRKGLETTPANKRSVLPDDVWFSVRYLLMTDKEFLSGPMASGILNFMEAATIMNIILKHPDPKLQDPRVVSLLTNLPRGQTGYKRSWLSMRSDRRERDDNIKNKEREDKNHSKAFSTRAGNLAVRALACVFD